jgi:hypothetical protein
VARSARGAYGPTGPAAEGVARSARGAYGPTGPAAEGVARSARGAYGPAGPAARNGFAPLTMGRPLRTSRAKLVRSCAALRITGSLRFAGAYGPDGPAAYRLLITR